MKFTPIEIDKMRRLRYDFNAIADMEAATGKTMTQLLIALYNSSFYAARAVMWTGLKHEDESLTILQTGELASCWMEKSGGNMGDLIKVLIDALQTAGWIVPLEESEEGVGQGESIKASVD
jgi:hypothetical protein